MSTQNIGFYEELTKFIFELSSDIFNLLLIILSKTVVWMSTFDMLYFARVQRFNFNLC